jgi:hypothetical protein
MKMTQILRAPGLALALSLVGTTAAFAEAGGGGTPCAPDCVRMDSPGQSSICACKLKSSKSTPGSTFEILPQNVTELAKGKVGGVCHHGTIVGKIAAYKGVHACAIPATSFK